MVVLKFQGLQGRCVSRQVGMYKQAQKHLSKSRNPCTHSKYIQVEPARYGRLGSLIRGQDQICGPCSGRKSTRTARPINACLLLGELRTERVPCVAVF